jgi:type VI secretion system secreted protein VgrG
MIALVLSALAGLPIPARAEISLGSAENFGVLAGSTITNTGSTAISGEVGVSPGTAITGFPPGTGVVASAATAAVAETDLAVAYAAAAGLMPTHILTGEDLGGMTLTPGVYFFASTAQLTGTLTLDDGGNPNAQFVFQIGSALNTATDSSVVTTNGGSMPGSDVFWQVGSSATLGTGTAFEGNILALTSITMITGANIEDGRALAINGAVTLDADTITFSSVPEPSAMVLSLIGGALLGLPVLRNRLRARKP